MQKWSRRGDELLVYRKKGVPSGAHCSLHVSSEAEHKVNTDRLSGLMPNWAARFLLRGVAYTLSAAGK